MRTHLSALPALRRLARLPLVLGAAALTIALAACGSDDADESSSPETDSAALTTEAAALTVTDPWIKAAEDGMTAAFGTLVNNGEEDITLAAATSDVAEEIELHETVAGDDGAMAMQEKDGGFVIPAGGQHELAPGGDHLMLMGLTRAVEPGEIVTIRIELADGSTTEIDATVKAFTGAQEEYHGDDDHSDHDHSDDEHDSGHGDS